MVFPSTQDHSPYIALAPYIGIHQDMLTVAAGTPRDPQGTPSPAPAQENSFMTKSIGGLYRGEAARGSVGLEPATLAGVLSAGLAGDCIDWMHADCRFF